VTALDYLTDAANLTMIAFLTWEFRRIPAIPLVVGSILLAVGLVASFSAGVFIDSLWRGVEQTHKFLVLFGAVAFLQIPASPSSPRIR
jgi:hypothetical protein